MKLEQFKCKALARAKNLYISKSYLIGCTGQKAIIMDRQLNVLHTVEGLDYVYSAEVSPDETKLLLISNGNRFYIVDMKTFEKTRITVRAPYHNNLEGRGCWAFDGKSVLIPVQHNDSLNSTLRCYCADDFGEYKDYLADKYHITGIQKIEKTRTYFLMGYNRKEENRDYFIYFDGVSFQVFPVENSVGRLALTATVDAEKDVVTVCYLAGCWQFTLEGKEIKAISHPKPKSTILYTSDVFMRLFDGDTEKVNKLKSISGTLEIEDISVPDSITKYELSNCGGYIYLASDSGFYLLDANTGEVLASVLEKYGVQNFEELTPGLIAIATWSGVKFYKFFHQ